MENPSKTFPEIGWFKERFQVININDDVFEFECIMSAKWVVPPYLHEDCDEEFTALEGMLTVQVGNKLYELQPQNKIIAPEGSVHSLRNSSKEIIRFKVSMKPNNGVSSLFAIMMFLQ